MNLLIVDDEIMVVDIIRSAVDWENLGFTDVFTAYNALEAKRILEEHTIAVALCDIEMPLENGLTLIEWELAHSPETVNIILTGQQNFEYAKEAVSKKVFRYLLKPVPFDQLKATCAEAVHAYRTAKTQSSLISMGKLWEDNTDMVTEKFFSNLLSGYVLPSLPSVKLELERMKLPFDASAPCRLYVFHGRDTSGSEKGFSLEFALRNIAGEIFETFAGVTGFHYHKNFLLVSFECADRLSGSDAGASPEAVAVHSLPLKEYMSAVNRFLNYPLCVFVSGETTLPGLAGAYGTIEQMMRYYLITYQAVHYAEQFHPEDTYDHPDFAVLDPLFLKKDAGEMIRRLQFLLDEAVFRKKMNTAYLKRFQYDFLRFLHQNADEEEALTDYIYPPDTLEGMKQWLSDTVTALLSKGEKPQDSIVRTAIRFIDRHFTEEITRWDVASTVFVNPDYLNRIFKLRTGCSIGNYIRRKRLDLASRLLRKTNDTVSSISTGCGFESPAYFTKLFKRETGMTPQEYREKQT